MINEKLALQRMSVPVTRTTPTVSANLRVAQILTVLIALLAAVAAAGGLFIPGLYRDPATFVPILQGQDLVTLIALPVLLVMLLAARRGSARATLAWLGLLGYLCYTYTGAAFAYAFNDFFLIYVALFALSVGALAAVASGIDAIALQRRFDAAVPRRPVAVFLSLIALMLAIVELGEIIAFLTSGTIPQIITRSGGITNFVYVLDLGVIVPLALLAVIWLWRRLPWGDILAGFLLIKASTMGLALLSMNWFSMRAGLPTDGLLVLWSVIAFGGLGLSVWFLRHCRE